jgi:hypothetical protein
VLVLCAALLATLSLFELELNSDIDILLFSFLQNGMTARDMARGPNTTALLQEAQNKLDRARYYLQNASAVDDECDGTVDAEGDESS